MTKAEQEQQNRTKQQAEFEEKQELAAESRPDLVHRAIRFLIGQAVMNNRDCKREAEYFERMLDLKFGDPERLSLEHDPQQQAEEGKEEGANGEPPAVPGQSRRFRR